MRKSVWVVAVAGLSVCKVAFGVTRDDQAVPGLPIIRVTASDTVKVVRALLLGMLDDGLPFGVIGEAAVLGGAMPNEVQAWPDTGAWIVDPREGLGVHAFSVISDEERLTAFAAWYHVHGAETAWPKRGNRVGLIHHGDHTVALEFVASTPATVCRSLSREMYYTLFGDATPTHAEMRAFRTEVRRWCQYGVFSQFSATPRGGVIEPFSDTKDALLSLTTEWAFIRNEDRVDRSRVVFSLWMKTVGEGAGFGFTRRSGLEGTIDPEGTIHNIMDVAIHSGWGGLADPRTVTAWPLNSTFPGVGNTLVFECDGLDGHLRFDCPARPRLRRLYPQDSHGETVVASRTVKFDIVGNARVSSGAQSGAAPKVTFGLDVMHGTTETSQVNLSLVHTFSNADTIYHRSTHWMPDITALRNWVASQGHTGNLMRATPLASTLNPRYEILWDIPLAGNEGRVIPYFMIYEVGWNTCDVRNRCADARVRPGVDLPVKGRVAWVDGMSIRFPVR